MIYVENQARFGAARALRICLAVDRWKTQYRRLERELGLDDASTRSRGHKWEIAALRFKSTILRYAERSEKAGFRDDQPRWSAGRGRISGRWSGGAGTGPATPDDGNQRRDRRDGHHFMPRGNYKHLPLSDEVRKVFDGAKTGPLRIVHGWDEPHARYNEATKELMDRFLERNGIQPDQMTADQARSLVREIHESKDPRIRNFNMRIRLREFLYRFRSRGRGNE